MKIDRLLSITILLLSRDRVTAKELAERFEVSIRTIYRDMETINISGIPIISFTGTDGGYGIMEGFKLDRQIFTTKDMISVLSPLEGINKVFKSEGITKVIDKIHALVPNNQKEVVKTSLSRILIDIEPWGRSEHWKTILRDIQLAIEKQIIIKILYTSGDGISSKRSLEPMTLIFKNFTWYIWGFCLKRQDYRMFKLNRIVELNLESKSFIHRGENYTEPVKHNKNIVNLVLKCNMDFFNKSIELFGLKNITKKSSYIIVNIQFPEGEWIKEFILSLGANVEVIEPISLRNSIIKELTKSLNIYSK